MHDHDRAIERAPAGALRRTADRRRLRTVLALTFGYTLAEVAGGLWTDSLALLADAGHMLTDVGSLGLALGALWMAERPATTRHTYAFGRVEILAALLNGLLMWAVVGWIGYEALERVRSPSDIRVGPMLAIAAGGLAINALGFWILHRGPEEARHSLNLRGATLHVVGDMLGSLGAIVAGIVIWTTGWRTADPAASLLIGLLILVSSWRIMREAVHILLEGTPRGVDVEALMASMLDVDGVAGVHDLHIWTITSGYPALSAHVVCDHEVAREMLLARINRVLREKYDITHTTIQLEPELPPDHARPMAHPIETLE